MFGIVKFATLLLYINLALLLAVPIPEYEELECSAQDDEILSNRSKRAARTLSKYPIWPESVIHYIIDCPNFTNEEKILLKTALNDFESKTCLRFIQIKEKGNIHNLIRVQCKEDGGCKSELGFQGRPQILNLQVHRARNSEKGGCMTHRKIQHEFMHALGFRHEHNSPIRNQYVNIVKQNIAKGWENYFDIDNPADYDNYGCPYDYNSVMHPDSYRHSTDKKPTIVPLDKSFTVDTLGRGERISNCDITRIKNMYCNSRKSGTNNNKIRRANRKG